MRLEISRRADLAVQALLFLARGDRMKAGEVAAAIGSTPGFVPQVIGPLVKRGWVRSDPGPSGGYALATSLDDVSVLDVVEAIDGPTDAGQCVVADRPCGVEVPCVMHVAWSRARAELMSSLASMSIGDLVTKARP